MGGTGLPVLSVVHGVGWQEGPQGAADPSPGRAAAPRRGVLHCAWLEFAQGLSVVWGCSGGAGIGVLGWGCWVGGCWVRGCWGGVPRLSQALLALLCAHGRLCPWDALRGATRLLSASQNDYKIDPSQELLALGKRPLGAGWGSSLSPWATRDARPSTTASS